jgi:uncharacterized protein (DUF952 family)
MTELIYKIIRRAEWEQAIKAGAYTGSIDDRRDGFLHFSAASQVRTTFDKHFSNETELLIVSVDAARLGSKVKWEVSRGGEKFPHLYGVLALEAVQSAVPIRRDAQGRPIFPPEIS